MQRTRWITAAAAAAALWAAPTASADTVYGLTDANGLVTFDSATPGAVSAPLPITGIGAGETIKGIDVRPATLQLYALSSSGTLYRVDTVTGAATAVGGMLGLTGTDADIDFNPTVDRLRIVTDSEQNLRVNPNSGALAATDGALSPAGNVTGAAYTNNAPASATFPNAPSTQLFDVDTGSDQLLLQNPPNNGTLTVVGALGTDLVGDVGFDIATASNTADGTPGANSAYLVGRTADGADRLYGVNLTTGAATAVGEVGGASKVRDIAVAAAVPQLLVLASGPAGTGEQQLLTVRADRPGAASAPVTVSGLQAGEQLVGIDRRPLDGSVFAVSDQRRVYVLNPATGVATRVGTGTLSAFTGTAFGVDFNPVPDRLRVVSSAGENRRVNPADGAETVDTTLAYAAGDANAAFAPQLTGAAYTNPFAGTAATALFYLDTGQDVLATTATPNTGPITTVGALGVAATDQNGYDIARRFNQGFVALQTAALGASKLYAVNVAGSAGPPLTAANGSAVAIGDLALGASRFAQGLTVVNDNALPAAPTPVPSVTPTMTPTAVPTYVIPTPTPTPYAMKKRPGLTGKVAPKRDRRKPFRFTVSGQLKRPAGVTKAAGCKGRVRITVRRNGKVLARTVASVKASCRYVAKVRLNKKAGRKGKARFTIAFGGNSALLTKTITRTARYGR